MKCKSVAMETDASFPHFLSFYLILWLKLKVKNETAKEKVCSGNRYKFHQYGETKSEIDC